MRGGLCLKERKFVLALLDILEERMKNKLRLAVMVICFGILCTAFLSTAKADNWDKKTTMTFSGPVKVENTTLPAGTYVFKLMSGASARHIVQIFNKDESQLLATVLTASAARLEPTENTEIQFAETSSSGEKHERVVPRGGLPIKQWFYPGDISGEEFPLQAASTPSTKAESTDFSMPETASELPLIGLMGLLSLGLAAGLHFAAFNRA